MTRHAGFGAVASIAEAPLNVALTEAIQEGRIGPVLIPLPTTVQVGSVAVNFAGLLEVQSLSLELHEGSGNRIAGRFGFQSTFTYSIGGDPPSTVIATFAGSAAMVLASTIVNKKISVVLDFSTLQMSPLAVSVIQGTVIQSVIDALQSPGLANIVANAMQSFPALAAPIPITDAEIDYQAGGETFPGGSSVFDWFLVRLTVSRVVVKPMEKALTVAVDFAGLTNGDENQLLDLTSTRGVGSTYRFVLPAFEYPSQCIKVGKNIVCSSDHPVSLFPAAEPVGTGVAVSINMEVLHAVSEQQVSPQVAGTFIASGIRLNSVSLNYSTFDTDLQGRQDGLALNANVEILQGQPPFSADAHIYLQPYLLTWNGTPPDGLNDSWLFFVAKVEIEVPLWVDVALFVLVGVIAVAIPLLGIVAGIAGVVGLADIVPSLLGQVEAKARNKLQNSSNSFAFPAMPEGMALSYVSFTSESIDIGIDRRLFVEPATPRAQFTTDVWPVTNKAPVDVQLRLRSDLARLSNIILNWQVLRADTGAEILTATKSYADPAGNGVLIPHHTPELYFVDAFLVRCTATASVGAQADAPIFQGEHTVNLIDEIDRHHRFVHWSKTVHFKAPPPNDEWRIAFHKSKLHRTAVSARCLELKRRMTRSQGRAFMPEGYADSLPFGWGALDENRRGILCDYCFFGGPDKHVPFPEEDWF